MATPPTRELKTGKLIDKALAVLERSAVPALIFVVALTVLCVPITYLTVGSTSFTRLAGAELLRTALVIVCSYFLLVAMLRRTGLHPEGDEDSFLPFIGLSILSALAIMLGVLVFILPGIFMMVRWSMAQPLLVAGQNGVMKSLGESWERTRGNEFQIIGAALALLLPLIAIGIAMMVFFEQTDPVRMVVSQLASSASTVVFLSMAVALYGLIVGATNVAQPTS